MQRSEIVELHYVAPIANVPSIIKYGILSHKLAGQLAHQSVAMLEIQERRTNKQIPGARKLHEYVCLYIDAHNPMLSRLREKNDEICVLRVDPCVLDLSHIIIADRNAAADLVRFLPLTDGLRFIDRDRVFARYWTHPEDLIEERRHKAEKCAEVLIPDRIEVRFIVGAYVAGERSLERFNQLDTGLPVSINCDIFF